MEATALSVGKSVLNGALSYAKSALAEEVALQLGVRRDQVYIINELEMMQAFLMSTHDEGDEGNKVVKVWVKQVRDVAYNVEDCLQEFTVCLQKQSWWRVHRTLLNRRRVAKQVKELRVNVEDVCQRNMRYQLVRSKLVATAAPEISSTTSATMLGIEGARYAAKRHKLDVDLSQLLMVNKNENNDLLVIAVWGACAGDGQTSIIRAVYDNPLIRSEFQCQAWVRLTHPFNRQDFIRNLVEQFQTCVGAKVLLESEKTAPSELAEEFEQYVNEKRYLIVLNGLSTIEEWDQHTKYFPNNKKGSKIIVSTTQVEVARLCAGQESIVSRLKGLSADQNVYAFYYKGSQNGITSADNNSTLRGETLEDQSKCSDGKSAVNKRFARIKTMVAALEESHLVGREREKREVISLISKQDTPRQFQVISVWGMGGLGKTTLVKDIYQREQQLRGMFEKRACVTLMRPFNLEELLRSLLMQLGLMTPEDQKGQLMLLPVAVLIKELVSLLEGKRCLIVLDDVSSTIEWNMIVPIFRELGNTMRIIVTTREESIARHCSKKQENVYKLKGLEYKDAHDLFTKKVFQRTSIDMDKQYPELAEQAKLMLQKCNQHPLSIATMGGFLANEPKTCLEWRKLNEHISAKLEMNPELDTTRTILMRIYAGLPNHLKSCFLYMPIFPKGCNVGRERLVRRWSAEGYPGEELNKSEEEISDSYFMELINRSMTVPSQESIYSRKGIDSCQVHGLMREIGISKSMEENLVFTLEEGCSSNRQVMMRHLAISSNWEGDQNDFKNMVDVSRVRSLTVYGKWKSFFISDRMRLLRVLDLEDTTGLCDHHLKDIGKFLHLRYLSLRGCVHIHHLPDSLGNLRQLETLDIRGTSMVMLPKTIIKLRNLRSLRGKPADEGFSYEELVDGVAPVMRNRMCILPLLSMAFCEACCAPQLIGDNMNRHDVCTGLCCHAFPTVAMRLNAHGFLLPRGMGKLKALHTLDVVNIGWRGKAILQGIKGLTRLRKLAVTGVSKKNGQELCSAIVGLSRLESVSIRSEGEPGLCGCLDGMFSFPENLKGLKLYGNLLKLPELVQRLKNLVKLKLRSSRITEPDAAIQVLGNLPNLAFLHLLEESFKGEDVCLNFRVETFQSLVLLDLDHVVVENLKCVKFEQGATPNLELLWFGHRRTESKVGLVSGLPSLPSLKEFVLVGGYEDGFVEDLRDQLAENPNRPILQRR